MGFLVLAKNCSAEAISDVNIKQIGKYLELPEDKVNELVQSLINIFYSGWLDQVSNGSANTERMAVSIIMKKVVQIQTLNHLLVEAPLDITRDIIANSIKVGKIFLSGGSDAILNELEKLSVQQAIAYGMGKLFADDIKVTPGAIEFKYDLQKGGKATVLIQYLVIYKPTTDKIGQVSIRFYSPNYLEIPANKGDMYTELEHRLPPFVVDITGSLINFQLAGRLNINIDFPKDVPDLGIKPISLWEKYLLKPIEENIKGVEVIITKVTGKTIDLTGLWTKIKKAIADFNPFSPAGIIETSQLVESDIINTVEQENVAPVVPAENTDNQQLSLADAQEMIDDISEKIDVISQETNEMVGVETSKTETIKLENKEVKDEQIVKEEIEKKLIEERPIEENLKPVTLEKTTINLCQKTGEATRNKIIFNEIAWMGGINSANDEWIELKNISGQPIDLTGWQIINKDQKIKIIFPKGAELLNNGFYLLERTDDNTVPGIAADLIYTGSLSNSDEALYLFDNNCQLQDEVLASPDWPAGDNSSKRTMERRFDLSWQTSQNIGGTPKNENSVGLIVFTGGGDGGAPPPLNVPSSVVSSSYPKILINEIQINGTSSAKEDFVELYNPNTEDINLTDWYLQRKTENATSFSSYAPKILFSGKIIQAKNYFLVANASSSFLAQATTTYPLTEDNTLVIKNPDGDITDKVGWGQAADFETATTTNPPAGQSIGRKWSTTTETYLDTDNNYQDFEIQSPTPGALNQSVALNSSASSTENASSTEEELPEETPNLAVAINEIAWAGTKAESSDEWLELYNNTSDEIDLTGWILGWSHGTSTHSIVFSTSSILANGYFLIERSEDDNTVKDIPADWKGSFGHGLSNSGEKLELRDASNTLIDVVGCSAGWFAGTTTPAYISMERISSTSTATSTNWVSNNLIMRNGLDANGNKINGTPRAQNSVSKTETSLFTDLPFDEFNELTLTYLGSPYIAAGVLGIPYAKTLFVEPGVSIKFSSDWGYLQADGTLKARGLEDKKIVFTASNTANQWAGINFSASSTDSEINWAEISYAGKRDTSRPAIMVDASSIFLKNSTVKNYPFQGIKLINSSSTIEATDFLGPGISLEGEYIIGVNIIDGNPTVLNCGLIQGHEYGIYVQTAGIADIENNNFEENRYPIWIAGDSPVLSGNQSQNNSNSVNRIIFSGGISRDTIWQPNELPYLIGRPTSGSTATVVFGATFQIEPGVKVEFGSGSSLEINGTFLAEGTAGNQIIFDGYAGQTTWRKIYFSASSTDSKITNASVSRGGRYPPDYYGGTIWIKESKAEFENIDCSNNPNAICLHLENSSSTVKNSNFSNNRIGLKIEGDVIPVLENNTFSNNEKCDIYWPYGTTSCSALAELGTSVECGCCPY